MNEKQEKQECSTLEQDYETLAQMIQKCLRQYTKSAFNKSQDGCAELLNNFIHIHELNSLEATQINIVCIYIISSYFIKVISIIS